MAQLITPAMTIIEGGRAGRVGGAFVGIFMGLLLLLMIWSGISRDGSKLPLLLIPAAAISIIGAIMEAMKALKPSRILLDADGITFEDVFTTKRWGWDVYRGAMSHRISPLRYRAFIIAVKAEPHRLRHTSIGPFPADLAETLQNYAASVGREVRLVPPFD